eukprot:12399955-Karenia_brevis.AAC.1
MHCLKHWPSYDTGDGCKFHDIGTGTPAMGGGWLTVAQSKIDKVLGRLVSSSHPALLVQNSLALRPWGPWLPGAAECSPGFEAGDNLSVHVDCAPCCQIAFGGGHP